MNGFYTSEVQKDRAQQRHSFNISLNTFRPFFPGMLSVWRLERKDLAGRALLSQGFCSLRCGGLGQICTGSTGRKIIKMNSLLA